MGKLETLLIKYVVQLMGTNRSITRQQTLLPGVVGLPDKDPVDQILGENLHRGLKPSRKKCRRGNGIRFTAS